MPELPEVETVRRSLLARLVGRRVAVAEASPVRLRAGIEPGQWRAVEGARLASIERRGKFLLLLWQERECVSILHLGMSGRLVVVPTGSPRPTHTHLVLGVEGDMELRFVDPRRFGTALTLGAAAAASYPPLVRLGADPLDPDSGPILVDAARRSRSPIRSLLLDQRVLAGVGNIYANEALSRAGINPARRSSAISRMRLGRLAEALRQVLAEAVEQGGTTLEDGGFVDAAGESGYFAVRLRVYGREGEPCERCGETIVRRTLGGRSVFLCPRCQR